MSPSKRYAKKQAKARQRRRLHAQARLARDRCQVHLSCDGLTRKGLAPLVGPHYAGRGRCSMSAWQPSDPEG
jgi:hypothetical protein